MFVYIARIFYGRGSDSIILGVAKTEAKAKSICERDLKNIDKETNGNWEKKHGYYLTLNRNDNAKYTISDWVLEGE